MTEMKPDLTIRDSLGMRVVDWINVKQDNGISVPLMKYFSEAGLEKVDIRSNDLFTKNMTITRAA